MIVTPKPRPSIRRISSTALFVLLLSGGPPLRAQTDSTALLAQELVWHAIALHGVPYRWGGSNPATGLDCSGLVNWVARQVLDLALPRRTEEIAATLPPIAQGGWRSGDLVFFNTLGRPNSHVGVYIGDGQFVHAPAGRGSVRIESMHAPYWRTRFNGARRFPGLAARHAARPTPESTLPASATPAAVLPDPYDGP